MDYRHLNDPFSDEENEVNAVDAGLVGGEDPKTLKEAQKSIEWPEWEHAIETELDQLEKTGTWRLIEKPVAAIPIANKWVFTKKYSKSGELETFSPVVRMETIRAILAIAAIEALNIQQMDVKGAYLNGLLKEIVETLYGLKQSGREWNRELDQKLEIITVWVDDLLLFAMTKELMAKMKCDLH